MMTRMILFSAVVVAGAGVEARFVGGQEPEGPGQTAIEAAPAVAAPRAATSSAEEVLDAYVRAAGGPSAWEGAETFVTKGVYTGSHLVYYDADELPFETFMVGADRWHRSWPQSGITETMVPERGWLFYPGRGVPDQPARQHAFFLRELPRARAEWRNFFDRAELIGDVTFDGEPATAVALHSESADLRVVRYFSRDSKLLIASETAAGDGVATVRYSDYRPVGPVLLPHLEIVDIGEDTHHEFAIHSVEVGVDVDPALFERPEG